VPLILLDPVVATALAAVVGLLVGSFLNVVIHRLPKILERGWQDQCAELRGETPRRGRATTSWCLARPARRAGT
jgi:leader peptidase (prepilin peptidase)/N-methyltransferase